MKTEVLLALLHKIVEKKFSDSESSLRGPRGFKGLSGEDGKPFSIEEHGDQIREWIRESTLKFEDLTDKEIDALRGAPGKDGRDGKSFLFDENKEDISLLITNYFNEIKNDLKLKFDDLSDSDKDQIRGARGQRGKAGRDFVFEDHLEYFQSLKLKFNDLTLEEKDSLTLKFSQLSQEEKDSLKLKFDDLSDEDREKIRGARGQRGKQGLRGEDGLSIKGEQGVKGDRGQNGLSIRGEIGPQGLRGERGFKGDRGDDGQDAPSVYDIELVEDGKYFYFVFKFTDGSEIKTTELKLPKSVEVYVSGGGVTSGALGPVEETFETISRNLKSSPFLIEYSLGKVDRITYTTSEGLVYKNFLYIDNKLTKIILSGSVPTIPNYEKNFNYDSGTLESVFYT